MHRPSFRSLFIHSLILHLLLSIQSHSQQEQPFLAYCSRDSFGSPSPYESNLRRLLTGLVASTPNSPSLYSKYVEGISSSSQIFGLMQCRPDASAALCASCLDHSAAMATDSAWPLSCGNSKSATFRYEYCLISYSEKSFFDTFADKMISNSYSALNASDVFSREVQRLMIAEIMPAAAEVSSRFAVGVSNESVVKGIYGMAWCLMDLGSSDCLQCLEKALATLQNGKQKGSASYLGCEVRFENHQFFFTAEQGTRRHKSKKVLLIGTSVAVTLFLFLALFILLLQRRKRKLKTLKIGHGENVMIVDVETLLFDFVTLRNATNNFSKENKLGQGGFGPVYKGVLRSGQEIAVKRLSKTSGQGLSEMKNEVDFVAKLQHKNLVQLLGYCLEGEEKLLVYEYLPNGSLDKSLFDPARQIQLNWQTRFKIIEEIGRGLLYLHEDSHFRIVHRDLKASNILLDGDMNPKISDFGLAKLFGVDETQKNTGRIAGTYGYMAPEYALRGRFSTKSDVYSFGVLILEIITGRKNSSFKVTDLALDLPSYIWRCWNEGLGLKVVDQSLGDEYQPQEVLRCIQIGLLCVQEDQAQRPNMATFVLMFSTNSITLPAPSKPAFYDGSCFYVESSKNNHCGIGGRQRLLRLNSENDVPASFNDLTITVMEAR